MSVFRLVGLECQSSFYVETPVWINVFISKSFFRTRVRGNIVSSVFISTFVLVSLGVKVRERAFFHACV